MTKNPFINALTALVYIAIVSCVLYVGTLLKVGTNAIIAPIALVSLFTLSAAVMGYIFLYQPAQLYFDNKKIQGVRLFLGTVMVFGCLTFIMLVLLFSGIFNR